MSHPTKVFKYVTADRIDILENGLIRFTQPAGGLNDPFELLPVFEELLPEEYIQKALSPSKEDMRDAFRRECEKRKMQGQLTVSVGKCIKFLMKELRRRPGYLEAQSKKMEPVIRTIIKNMAPDLRERFSDITRNSIGILSLTECPDNDVMWAHYADNHRGLVIEFDPTHEFFDRRRTPSDEFYHLRKVSYLDQKPKGMTLLDLSGNDFLCTKKEKWSYEQEWRILAPVELADRTIGHDDATICLFRVPLDAITGIILGMNSSPDLRSNIQSLLTNTDLAHTKLSIASINFQDHSIKIQELT